MGADAKASDRFTKTGAANLPGSSASGAAAPVAEQAPGTLPQLMGLLPELPVPQGPLLDCREVTNPTL
eukprot:3189005-Pyramimonas_sp.AAC.1